MRPQTGFLKAAGAANPPVTQEAKIWSGLSLTWIKNTPNGFHVDRSSSDEINRMSGEYFESDEAAKAAIIAREVARGAARESVIFPQRVRQY